MYRSTHSLFVSQFTRRSVLEGPRRSARGASPRRPSSRTRCPPRASSTSSTGTTNCPIRSSRISRRRRASRSIRRRSRRTRSRSTSCRRPAAKASTSASRPTTARRNSRTSACCSRSTIKQLRSPSSSCRACSTASTKNWTWDGKLYHVPHVWGTEAISWRNDLTKIDPARPLVRHAVERRIQGQGAGPPAFAAARHRPLAGRDRQAADQPHARRLSRTKTTMKKIYDEHPQGRDRPQALDQAVLGFRRQHQVRLEDQRRRDRPDLGRAGDHPEEGRQARSPIRRPRKARSAGSTAGRIVKGAKNVEQAYAWLKYTAFARRLGEGRREFRLQSLGRRRRQAAVGQGARRSSTRPIPARRSTRCGGARSSRRGSPTCAAQYAEKFKAA